MKIHASALRDVRKSLLQSRDSNKSFHDKVETIVLACISPSIYPNRELDLHILCYRRIRAERQRLIMKIFVLNGITSYMTYETLRVTANTPFEAIKKVRETNPRICITNCKEVATIA